MVQTLTDFSSGLERSIAEVLVYFDIKADPSGRERCKGINDVLQ